jgi:hypothetical protein
LISRVLFSVLLEFLAAEIEGTGYSTMIDVVTDGGLFENVSEIYSNVSQNDGMHTEKCINR